MDVCICGWSAVEFWRMWRLVGPSGFVGMGINPSPGFIQDWRSCSIAGRLPAFSVPSESWLATITDADGMNLSRPVDVFVSNIGDVTHAERKTCHCVPDALPARSIVRVAKNVYVVSPALALSWAAASESRMGTLRLLDEFCGTYAADPGNRRGYQQVDALVGADEIGQFIVCSNGIRGTTKLATHLPHAFDGCASPAEAAMATLLCAPKLSGCHGLPRPIMNKFIDARDARTRMLMDRSYYIGDAVWPDRKLVVEYDSKTAHSEQAAVAHDSIRRTALESMGYHVVSVTPSILLNEVLFSKVAYDVSSHLGVRWRSQAYGKTWYERNRQSRNELLVEPAQWYRMRVGTAVSSIG